MKSSRLVWSSFALLAAGCNPADDAELTSRTSDALTLTAPLDATELPAPLTKASIRTLQTWLDDATFEAKWTSMTSTPIELLGGASASYFADFAALPAHRLPGHQTICHGDPKLDNFGWTLVQGQGVFSDNDFDDAGPCPVAADALRYLVATDLWFSDPALDAAALESYVATVVHPSSAVAIDPSLEPDWGKTREKVLSKSVTGDSLVLGGEVQAATPAEEAAVRAYVAGETRIDGTVLDVARDVRTDGGSAGLRRFWIFVERGDGRTILELKELTTPATEFGPHKETLDGPARFDVLKSFWWGAADPDDHFTAYLLGSRFLLRDRATRASVKPEKMSAAQLENVVRAEASLLALRHRTAWGHHVDGVALSSWLQISAAALVSRWRQAFVDANAP